MTRVILATGAIAALLLIAGCGDEATDEPVSTADTVEQSAEESEADKQAATNERIANDYARFAPKALATVCAQIPVMGKPRAIQMATRILGAQVIKNGGQPSEVSGLLLEKC